MQRYFISPENFNFSPFINVGREIPFLGKKWNSSPEYNGHSSKCHQYQGLNFRAGWQDSRPKFRYPVEKNRKGRSLPPSLFQNFLILWNETVRFRKNNRFYCNAGQFLSDRGDFLLQIVGDSFPILRGIECCSIQKFGIVLRNIAYFASFQRNNSVIVQNDCGFKKYQLWKKFIFWQLVAKISNFTDIRGNNEVFMQKKKKRAF